VRAAAWGQPFGRIPNSYLYTKDRQISNCLPFGLIVHVRVLPADEFGFVTEAQREAWEVERLHGAAALRPKITHLTQQQLR